MQRTRIIPKVAWFLAASLLALGVLASGCGGDDSETADTAVETSEETATEESTTDATDQTGTSGETDGGETAMPSVAAGDASAGGQVFASDCAACHGDDGSGGTGPSLQNPSLADNPDAVVNQIVNGGGGMPAFGSQLSDQEISDVAAHVVNDLAAQ